MAKPVICFKGTKFKTGDTIGYRPQLEKCTNKVTDAALAEQVCLDTGLSMSPTELLHAIQMTLESVPRLVANDGRVREFTNLLCWNRSASGRLDGPGGAWNDSCSAKVLVQLKKNSKQLIDAQFRNEIEIPVPRLDNVTWIGAQGVTNAIKIGQPFAAYGRYMEMGTGDSASIIVGTTVHTLACSLSDAAHAVFAWPNELLTLEPGTMVTFVMTSHGGMEGAGMTTNKKQVVVLAPNPPDKQVEISNFNVYGMTASLKIANVEGVKGYAEIGGIKSCEGKYKIANREWVDVRLEKPEGSDYFSCSCEPPQSGQKAYIKLTVDPAKIEYIQGDVTAEYEAY